MPKAPKSELDQIPTEPVAVWVRCPTCQAEWVSAHLIPGTFWSQKTPRSCETYLSCKICHAIHEAPIPVFRVVPLLQREQGPAEAKGHEKDGPYQQRLPSRADQFHDGHDEGDEE